MRTEEEDTLQLELGTAPVTSLGIVANLIVRLHANPLGYWPILFLLLGQNTLNLECFVCRHFGFENLETVTERNDRQNLFQRGRHRYYVYAAVRWVGSVGKSLNMSRSLSRGAVNNAAKV